MAATIRPVRGSEAAATSFRYAQGSIGDTYCAAEVARDAALFLIDQREQFLFTRDLGSFTGYPEPPVTIGEAIVACTPRPPGRVVVTHLGVGLADLVFADAIVRSAMSLGLGTKLSR